MASENRTARNNLTEAEVIDASLLEGCRSGDRDSQHRLYELSHHRVYRLMVRLQDAMDATQQVFLQVFRKID